ncbi:MAG: hypothetical protein KDA63_03095 [Planctomycetales bacterium]|nr:hypothetical protein [Planctomycetales bacterium]
MKRLFARSSFAVLVLGVALGTLWQNAIGPRVLLPAEAQARSLQDAVDDGSSDGDDHSNAEVLSLRQDVEMLKGKVSSQSHAMADVDYHFTNLWFAAQSENWPLAEFYWDETMSHIRWAVRIIPVRKDKAGGEVRLAEILESIEQSPEMQIGETIERHDLDRFKTAYRNTLQGCYACHKAADKPYLRPRVPERPASGIVNFDPTADWPK